MPMSKAIVDATIRSLQDYIVSLENKRAEIDNQGADIDRKLGEARTSLQAMARQRDTDPDGTGTTKARRPRGQNLRDVRGHMASSAGTTFTPSTIAEALGLPPSSVQAVLSKHQNTFEQDPATGEWRLTEDAPGTE